MTSAGVIIQARLNSTRLPNKVLSKIGKKTVLEILISRVKKAKNLQKIILATTHNKSDKQLVRIAVRQKINYFLGDEEDVLSRFYYAAKENGLDAIVRITADCPFIDWYVIDKVIEKFISAKTYDYVSNVHPPTLPDGMDVEIFTFDSLEKAFKKARLRSEREHVTPYIWKHPKEFRQFNVKFSSDGSKYRLTLDGKKDLIFLRLVQQNLGGYDFLLEDIVNLLAKKPELVAINSGIVRNEGYIKSLGQDAENSNN